MIAHAGHDWGDTGVMAPKIVYVKVMPSGEYAIVESGEDACNTSIGWKEWDDFPDWETSYDEEVMILVKEWIREQCDAVEAQYDEGGESPVISADSACIRQVANTRARGPPDHPSEVRGSGFRPGAAFFRKVSRKGIQMKPETESNSPPSRDPWYVLCLKVLIRYVACRRRARLLHDENKLMKEIMEAQRVWIASRKAEDTYSAQSFKVASAQLERPV